MGRWEYINPPGYHKSLDKELFKRQGLDKKSEYKVYSLQAVGPKHPKSKGKLSVHFENYNKVLNKNGGRCYDVGEFLKIPKWSDSESVFDKMELLSTVNSAQERETYHLKNAKFLDNWLSLKREYDPYDPR